MNTHTAIIPGLAAPVRLVAFPGSPKSDLLFKFLLRSPDSGRAVMAWACGGSAMWSLAAAALGATGPTPNVTCVGGAEEIEVPWHTDCWALHESSWPALGSAAAAETERYVHVGVMPNHCSTQSYGAG